MIIRDARPNEENCPVCGKPLLVRDRCPWGFSYCGKHKWRLVPIVDKELMSDGRIHVVRHRWKFEVEHSDFYAKKFVAEYPKKPLTE